ncbi:MAG: hypothetical protein IPO90_14165 [Flavobacteriales bacterium]|nr:hypothetical protein [Flavobacteriales bacterium]
MRALPLAVTAAFALWHGSVGAQQYDLRVFSVEDGLPGSTVNAITQDSEGFLWVVTTNGYARFDGRHFSQFVSLEEVGLVAKEALDRHSNSVQEARLDRDLLGKSSKKAASIRLSNGDDLFATREGVLLYRGTRPTTTPRRIRSRNGLGDDAVRCLFQDASGIVWIGTEHNGISRLVSDAVTWFDERDGLPGSVVSGISSNAEGLILFTTSDGNAVLDTSFNISQNRVKGTDAGGSEQGETNLRILLANGHFWSATDHGVFDHSSEGYTIRVGRDTIEATAMAIAGDSVLIGTHAGLFKAPLDNSCANWTPAFAAGNEDITCLVHDLAGNIWMGTSNKGIVRYNKNGTQRWTTIEGLASDHIRLLLLDAYQNLWVGTDRGFNLMELDELQEQVLNIRYYGIADGFPGIEAMPNACMLDVDSSLWFGTTRGAIHFDPRRILEDPVAPRTRITDLAVFFEHPDLRPWCDTLDPEGLPNGLRLPHDQNHLTFTFTGLSLAYPEKVRFQYKLEGRDADWSPITSDDRVTMSGLEPGTYTFLVKARNGSGVWNDEPARFTFAITPPYWETTPFRITGGAALLLSFFGLQYLRDRRSRKTRERLERMVTVRTQELSDEKHRSDSLLLNILPETTAAELKENGTAQARSYAECTVLFSDFQGFTMLSEQLEATGIVTELDRFFRAFDRITDKYGTEKIKTIGDAYMCASGVPNPSRTHGLDAVLMALEMLSVVDAINAQREREGHPAWPIRIGLNSGPLIAGVVGEKKFAYDIWGDTVNLASRMESSGAPGRVNVTSAVLAQVERFVEYESRGKVNLKGKGDVECWFVDRLRPEFSSDERGRTANAMLMELRSAQQKA